MNSTLRRDDLYAGAQKDPFGEDAGTCKDLLSKTSTCSEKMGRNQPKLFFIMAVWFSLVTTTKIFALSKYV